MKNTKYTLVEVTIVFAFFLLCATAIVALVISSPRRPAKPNDTPVIKCGDDTFTIVTIVVEGKPYRFLKHHTYYAEEYTPLIDCNCNKPQELEKTR